MVANASWAVALEHATDQVMAPGDPPPDVVLLFASPAYGEAFDQLLRATRERTRAGILVGCSASGFLAGPDEVEDQPGLALMALWLPGATLAPVRFHQEHLDLLDEPNTWAELHGVNLAGINAWLVFAEPYRVDTHALLQSLQRACPGASIMGGMASGMIAERRSCVFFDGHWYDEGAVALGIGGPYSLRAQVSQGCEPVGETWTITGVDRNVVLGISNRPAVDVLHDTVTALPGNQRQRAQHNLVVGLAVNEYRDAFRRGDFVVRGILGLDPARGAIALGGKPRVGQTLQFHLRDAAAAAADMVAMLERAAPLPGQAPVAALLCTCDGRGHALFGVANHDAGLASRALGKVPLVGAFCIGEIGPLGGQTVLHGFTATLGLLCHEPG